jgi:hypothetical protein
MVKLPSLRVAGVLAASLACLVAAPDHALAGGPAVGDVSVVTTHAATGDGGNSWGGHQPRIVRTTRGVFTAYSVPTGGGPLRRDWRLARHGASGWRVIAAGPAGREPPSLLTRHGRLYVIAWPGGLPRMWTVAPRANGWRVRSRLVPGPWIRSDWPYATASISASGDIAVLQSNQLGPPTMRGDIRVSVRSAATRVWSSSVTPTFHRYCYAWLLPARAGGLDVVATRAATWAELGYRKPAGAFDYVYDAVRTWRARAATASRLDAGRLIRKEVPTAAHPYVYVSAAQPDVYRDGAGRLHVFYAMRSAATGGRLQLRHAILVRDRIVDDVALPSGLTYAKIVEDARGHLFVFGVVGRRRLLVYRAATPDASKLEPPTAHRLRHRLMYSGFNVADPRGGSTPSDRVDIVYPSGREQGRWVYFRLTLG